MSGSGAATINTIHIYAQDKFSQTRRLANRRQARTIQYVTDDDEANNNVCGNSDKQYAQDKFS